MSSHNRDFNTMTVMVGLFNLGLYASCVMQKGTTVILVIGAIATLIQCVRLIIYAAETSYTFKLKSDRHALKVESGSAIK